jgi:hypothetical protein
MSKEGKFIDGFLKGGPVEVPGGLVVKGSITKDQSNDIQCFFDTTPLSVKKIGAGACTGTAGDENLCLIGDVCWERHVLGTQTVIAPSLGTKGLNVIQDTTDNDGNEYCLGIAAINRGVFTVGTDAAFSAKMTFYIDDVSGTDDCAFGFRKVEAYQANIDDYDEMAALNVISGDIKVETILNGGATTTTDTTQNWADGETHTLEIKVSSAGVVTFFIDGMPPTTTATFTFDDGEVIVPFFYQIEANAAQAVAIELIDFKCGLQ